MSFPRIVAFTMALLAASLASAQNGHDLGPYLLRLENDTAYSGACVLLQKNGAYHLELGNAENTKVFEGSLKADELQQVASDLKAFLDALSERRIEEPLIAHQDLLTLDTVRDGRWSEVKFLSAESQEPYRRSLQPIVRWLNNLHKLPHRELSEDAGKSNCLVPRKIALTKRGDKTLPPSSNATATPMRSPPQQTAPTLPPSPKPRALLRLDSFGVKSETYYQDCVLVAEDGTYRAESRSQKTGDKRVDTKLNGGRLAPAEISQLQELLSDPALAEVRHRKTSHLELPVSGEMLELKIPRESGLQSIVLSSTFNKRGVPFFYSGDGDIARAGPLLRFLSEHVQNDGMGSLAPELRNGCTDAP